MKRHARHLAGLTFLCCSAVAAAAAIAPQGSHALPAARAVQAAAIVAPASFDAGAMMPMVEIGKTCPPMRYLGREATFEITVANRGNAPAANVVVTDTITGGLQFVSADNGGKQEGGNVIWRLGTLAEGKTMVLKTTFRCNVEGTVRNVARVSYCAEAAASCETEIKGVPAILLECVDDPDPIEVGGQLTYTIVVTNQGSKMGTNIKIECTLPPEQEFVSAGGAAAATATGPQVSFAALPTLAPKATARFTVTVKGIKAADSRFKVNLMSSEIQTPVEETESTHIYE